jgi:hypothetical protein
VVVKCFAAYFGILFRKQNDCIPLCLDELSYRMNYDNLSRLRGMSSFCFLNYIENRMNIASNMKSHHSAFTKQNGL